MSFRKRIPGIALSALIGVGAMLGNAAAAEELRYALGYPPGSDSDEAAQNYAELVEKYSDGSLTVKVYPLSLLNFAETSAGVRDGIANIGYLLTGYFPAQYPHTNLIAEASMQTLLMDKAIKDQEGAAYVGAMNEFIFSHCPECIQEYAAQNQVFTGTLASSPYGLHCNAPVTTAADLEGKRLRTSGSQWSRWARHFDATPVTLSGNEAFEALSQGVVDCVIISAPDLANLGIIDATSDTTMAVPGGVYAAASGASVNAATWRSLSDEQRKAMLRAAAHLSAEIPYVYQQREEEVLALAQERGIELHEADPALVEATHEFVKQDMETIIDYYAEQYGVERGDEMLSTFRPILEKWVERVQDVDNADDLAEIYWNEVFSKVDPSTYGL